MYYQTTHLNAIAEAVAGQENRDAPTVRLEIARRIAIVTARGNAQAIRKRACRAYLRTHERAVLEQLRSQPASNDNDDD